MHPRSTANRDYKDAFLQEPDNIIPSVQLGKKYVLLEESMFVLGTEIVLMNYYLFINCRGSVLCTHAVV